MTQQGGGEIQGPSTGQPGGTIEVTVGTSDTEVFVSQGGPPFKTYTVQDGKVTIPVPAGAAPGSVFFVFVGQVASPKYLRVEVVQP